MVRVDLLLVNAGELVTLNGPPGPRRGRGFGKLGIVREGALAVRDGTIVAVGPTRRLRGGFQATRTLDAEGSAVVPGFVDAHTHLPFAGTREFELPLKLAGKSYLEILRAGGGIHYTVRKTRRASRSDLTRLTLARMREMLAWGTTTVEAKSGYGLSLADEVKQLEAVRAAARAVPMDVVATFLGAHVVPQEFARRRREYVRLVIDRMLPTIARRGLAAYCDAFLEENAFTAAECKQILAAARRHGLGTKLHADEFTDQGGARLGARLGCTSVDHLLRVSRAGVRALARSPTVAVLLPGVSVTGFLPEFAPARRLVDAGAAVALGTDLNPNCHVLTMPTVLQWACHHLRLTPAEAVTAATINAAHAVGLEGRVGSLEVGKQADFLVLEGQTHVDLAYRVGPNPVRSVVKRGRVVGGRGLAA